MVYLFEIPQTVIIHNVFKRPLLYQFQDGVLAFKLYCLRKLYKMYFP